MPTAPPCTQHSLFLVYGPESLPPGCRTLPQITYQQCQVLKVPSSPGHKVPDAEHWAIRTGEWVIKTVFEIGAVPGVQGIGSRKDIDSGQMTQRRDGSRLSQEPPGLPGEVELAEGYSIFDEECEVLGLS